MAPVSAPVIEGVKVTLIEQLPPAVTPVPQVLDWEKLLDPELTKMLAMARVELLLLVSVTDCGVEEELTATLPNVKVLEERETAPTVPVPVRLTVWGLPLALSLMLRVAARVPIAVGVKVTLIVQVLPGLTVLQALKLSEKSPGLAHVNVALVIETGTVPVLVTLTL